MMRGPGVRLATGIAPPGAGRTLPALRRAPPDRLAGNAMCMHLPCQEVMPSRLPAAIPDMKDVPRRAGVDNHPAWRARRTAGTARHAAAATAAGGHNGTRGERHMMIRMAAVLVALAGAAMAALPVLAADVPPAWAYAWDPDYKAPPADDVPRELPGSTARFSSNDARNLFFSPDWHPGEHAPLPDVVSRGRRPDVRACGSCHRAEGTGGPENASLAGQPAAYIVQQMADFRSGARQAAVPQRISVVLMLAAAKAATAEEVQAAAAYFSALRPRQVLRVIESDTVPRTDLIRLFYARSPQGGTEPLGRRIIEMPDDAEQFELRDSATRFTAYVPVGSVARGAALVQTGADGTTVRCATCHGPALHGVGAVPGIAGRSPSYVMRQLHDFRQGLRAGPGSVHMKPTVEKLGEDDMLAIAAYLATLAP